MTALDFLEACAGCSILVVAIAAAIRILLDTRGRGRSVGPATQPVAVESPDPLTRRYQDLRDTTFGKPMDLRTPQTWPVMRVAQPPAPKAPAKEPAERPKPPTQTRPKK